MRWDPTQYSLFERQRSRPYVDLVAQIGADSPQRVLDVGCGSGQLTQSLAERWPWAEVAGVDSSAEMVAQAPPGIDVTVGSAHEVDATGIDVLVTNAMLQWVPDHGPLLQRWARELADDGWLALQVPANFDAPSHALLRELAPDHVRSALDRGAVRLAPEDYLALLSDAGLEVEVWQTTYLHVLQGPDPVLEWMRGTGLRPVLAALDPAEVPAFEERYAAALRAAYPAGPHGTVLPFTRTFAVGHKPARLVAGSDLPDVSDERGS